MPRKREIKRKLTTGLAGPASTVAMAAARSLTSHARKVFRLRYAGRFKYARLMFVFDALLVLVALVVLLVDLALFAQSWFMRGPGLELTFTAPVLRSSDAVSLQAAVRVTDNRTHDDVVLRWRLPDWVEVVRAEPALGKDGGARLGTLGPGEVKVSTVLARIRAERGVKVPIGFTLHQYDLLGLNRDMLGADTRVVKTSALTAVSAFQISQAVSGASFPILIHNAGSLPVRAAFLRLTKREGAPDASLGPDGGVLVLGELAPNERRVAFIDLGETAASSVVLGWELQDGAQAVDKQEQKLKIVESRSPIVISSMRTSRDMYSIKIAYKPQGARGKMFIAHPLLQSGEPFEIAELNKDEDSVTARLRSGAASSTQWSVIPVFAVEQAETLGPREVSSISAALPFSSIVRYYSAVGDQLGVGPLPPKIGESTTYWVVWTVGPLGAVVRDLVIETTLQNGVRATGKFASEFGGSFFADGPRIAWTVPSLALAGSETASFAFEIEFTPSARMAGKVVPLIGESSARGDDASTGARLEAEVSSCDTDLTADERAKGKGRVER